MGLLLVCSFWPRYLLVFFLCILMAHSCIDWTLQNLILTGCVMVNNCLFWYIIKYNIITLHEWLLSNEWFSIGSQAKGFLISQARSLSQKKKKKFDVGHSWDLKGWNALNQDRIVWTQLHIYHIVLYIWLLHNWLGEGYMYINGKVMKTDGDWHFGEPAWKLPLENECLLGV